METINKTSHLEQRMGQRGVRTILFNLAIDYGCIAKAPHGADYYYFSTKSIKKMNFNLRNKFDRSKSVGIILGVDKPPLLIRDNRLFLQFIDTTANITPMTEHIKSYDNSTVEFFYWSPSSADILRKQAWTVLKYLKLNKHYKKLWDWSAKLPTSPYFKQARTIA
mgnify:CR=1 FL=1